MASRSVAFVRELFWELARVTDVASITPGGSLRRLAKAWLVLTIKQRRGITAHDGFELHWTGPNGPVRAGVGVPSEIRVIREVFVNEDYALPEDVRPKSILDLGSNVGLSILYFHSRYPTARIIGVEPAPDAFARLRRNTQGLSNVSIVQAAAVGTSRTVDLVISRESWTSSIYGNQENETVKHVDGLTVEQILERQGLTHVEVIKMDVEGCEV